MPPPPCDKCHGFMMDFLARPISPIEEFYDDIHHKRLARIMPQITKIIIQFFERVSSKYLSYCIYNSKYTVKCMMSSQGINQKELNREIWRSMARWCKRDEDTYLEEVDLLLEMHCVFKEKDRKQREKRAEEWLGNSLIELLCVLDIHHEHSRVIGGKGGVGVVEDDEDLYA
jgi:hypothetical protein